MPTSSVRVNIRPPFRLESPTNGLSKGGGAPALGPDLVRERGHAPGLGAGRDRDNHHEIQLSDAKDRNEKPRKSPDPDGRRVSHQPSRKGKVYLSKCRSDQTSFRRRD